ncbi:MAG: MFS transporter [Lachnospiraceae bacterium]|nr:MFS transporter [Lachnospiraceae bacterium]
MKRIFQMYAGLRKEVYILCFGRFVTSMGALIWPMLTLILKSKLGFDADEVALWFLVFSILQLPVGLLGGKLTDRYNKRNIIILFDLISVATYIITAFLPLTPATLCIYFVGSLFQHMEWPAYDALIAEMTSDHDREKAYSLQYLGSNLGIVAAPTIGGLLFNNYLWLSFLISGLAIFTSTMLIFFFIPSTVEKAKHNNTYEENQQGTLMQVLMERKILITYVLITCVSAIVYQQFNYLLPIQMDAMFLEQGAVYFGMLTSTNAFVVILCTPLLTQLTLKWADFDRLRMGALLEIIGICSFYFYSDTLILYMISMVVFTLGEIMMTLGRSPYISKRIPSSHRGRFTSIVNIFRTVSSSLGNTVVGKIVVLYSIKNGWIFVGAVGIVLVIMMTLHKKEDMKQFALLYKEEGK